MAIEVYEGQYTGSEIDSAIGEVNTITVLIPSGASSSNQLATASDITGITDKIPSGASSSNKLATASDISGITELIPTGASTSNKLATASDIPDISGINAVIPSGASALNQLATESEITGITEKIPSGASSSNKMATASDISAITDLIPSGASVSNQLATASDIPDISGITAVIPSSATASNQLATESEITGITDLIPTGASSSNKLSTASDITGITEKIPATASSSNKLATASDITGITEKIPAAASSSNKLADKDFVNSSVSTNTANYISNSGQPFASVADLEAYSGTVTNNDYAFVTGTDTAGNTYYDRYKATVSGSTVTWAKEYRLNNSSFTSTQWDAINSGITSSIIPSGASSNNKLATMSDIPSGGSGIAGVQINGTDLTPDANDKVNIPMSSTSALGVIKTSDTYKTDISTGELCASTVTYANYASLDDSAFISKGTLDNVLTGKNINDVSDETWTFTVDDGQGGTTTVTKTIKVGTTPVTPAQVGE